MPRFLVADDLLRICNNITGLCDATTLLGCLMQQHYLVATTLLGGMMQQHYLSDAICNNITGLCDATTLLGCLMQQHYLVA